MKKRWSSYKFRGRMLDQPVNYRGLDGEEIRRARQKYLTSFPRKKEVVKNLEGNFKCVIFHFDYCSVSSPIELNNRSVINPYFYKSSLGINYFIKNMD